MNIKISYEPEFTNFFNRMHRKYGENIFTLEGLNGQLDINAFSKSLYSKQTTADNSIDANSNVSDFTPATYINELTKPFLKLNSFYLLWKQLRWLYNNNIAEEILEKQINGTIYINDFHGIAGKISYSYHKDTTLILKINGKQILTTMGTIFNKYKKYVEKKPDKEIINIENVFENHIDDINGAYEYRNVVKSPDNIIKEKCNIEILDGDGTWCKLKYIIRHKRDSKLLKIHTKNGRCTIVTDNHPVILEDDREIDGGKLKIGDKIKESHVIPNFSETISFNLDMAYTIGFWLAEGSNCKHSFTILQKDIKSHKIFNILKSLFKIVNTKDNIAWFGSGQFQQYIKHTLKCGDYSYNKKLPENILYWDKESIGALISGIIDGDGTVFKNDGYISIRVCSFAMIQQLKEVLKIFGIEARTKFTNKYKSNGSYASKQELFYIGFRINKDIYDYFKMSDKISKNKEMCIKETGKDGRWETNEICYIEEYNSKFTYGDSSDYDYVYDVTTDSGTFYSQSLYQHNCWNFSCLDLVNKGLPFLKIKIVPPKYLYSFKSQLEQFIVYASNSLMGASGVADIFVVMSWYVDKILDTKSDGHFRFSSKEDCWKYIEETIASFIYTLNQPFRSAIQTPFTNVSIYDDIFLQTMLEDYVFPDKINPKIDTIKKIQELFLEIMNKEMSRTPITFPVTTACFSVDKENNIQDKQFLTMIANQNREFGFINIYCGDSSTLSSCCRLRSSKDSPYFNSFGGASSSIGSLGVTTINIPRLAFESKSKDDFIKKVKKEVETTARVNHAKRTFIKKGILDGFLPLYTHGFIDINKQYSTTGLIGIYEALDILGYDILSEEGQNLITEMLTVINKEIDKFQDKYDSPHNVEQIPGETSGIKLAKKDAMLGINNKYTIYSNQFIPLTYNADMLDRIELQGKYDTMFSGGAICHLNVEEKIEDTKKIEDLIRHSAKKGVIYFAVNFNIQECEVGHISVGKKDKCNCGKKIINNFTRVVGFLTNVKTWNKERRENDYPNRVFYK